MNSTFHIIPYILRPARRNIFGKEVKTTEARFFTIAYKKKRFSPLVYLFPYGNNVFTSFNISDAKRYTTEEEAQKVIDDMVANPDNYLLV